jgi:hypothetical protein
MHIPALCALISLTLLGAFSVAKPAFGEEEEQKPESRMWKRLKDMDADGDGKVSRDEFRGPDRFWKRLDGDDDGVVTRTEADKASQGMRSRGGGQGQAGDQRAGRGSMRGVGSRGLSFEKLDLDKDGQVSQREWVLFLERHDENKDSILQKEEWEAAVGGRPIKDDAPQVGAKTPKVSARMIDLPQVIDLGKPKRTTVLIFGSWT